ncbi:sensor histidine kinase [Schaalia naturae]|uniref:Sensor histidine kinase n=1 Tax=Schaalia naturae TaxID=635203 RepID=A0ABW2SNV6_9ACTO
MSGRQRTRLASLIDRQPHGGTGRRIVFGLLAALLFVLEVTLGDPTSRGLIGIELTLGACAALASAGWLPALGGTLFGALMLTGIALPDAIASPVLLGIGLYAVIAEWVSRRWYIPSVLLLAAVESAQFATTSSPAAEAAGLALGGVFAITLGLGIQWNERRVDVLREQAESSRRDALVAKESIQRELAAALHDTVARDLVQIIVDSQSIARRSPDPGTAEEVDHLGDLGRDAMRHVRSMMGTAAVTGDIPLREPVASVVEVCRQMLEGRGIRVDTDLPAGIDTACEPRAHSILALSIREGMTNVYKYGREGSPARLVVELLGHGGVALSMANAIDPVSQDARSSLMGGFGLDNLARAVANEGGRIRFGSTGGTWLLTVALPAAPAQELASGPLIGGAR